MKPLALLLLLASCCGCSQQDDCERVAAAISAYELRCNVRFTGEFPSCSAPILDDIDPDACEAALAKMECVRQPLPDVCSFTVLEVP